MWGSYSYETKVELARLFIQNNPNDCYALAEIAGSGAPLGLASRVEHLLFSGTTPRLAHQRGHVEQLSGRSRVTVHAGP